METTEKDALKGLSTTELIRRAIEEARMLARAEVMHAKRELKSELKRAKRSGMLLGAGAILALCGLAALFVALGIALPISGVAGTAVVGLVLLGAAGLLAAVGISQLPKKPLPETRGRIKMDLSVAREQLA